MVPCPRCRALSRYSEENKWRPFCSKRCKMIDLGAWASEAYRVPEKESGSEPDSDDDASSTSP